MKKHHKSYFDAHPDVEVLHFTGDKLAFFQMSDAEAHARAIKNEKIDTINRNEELEEDDDEEQPAEPVKTSKHKVSQEDLDNNPDIAGVLKVGQEVIIAGDSVLIPVKLKVAEPAPKAETPKSTAKDKKKTETTK